MHLSQKYIETTGFGERKENIMSQIQQLIAAINMSAGQIDQQSTQLRDFKSKLDELSRHVETTLGSSNSSGRQMLDQISATTKQIDDTLNRLQSAKEKLQQIRLV